ALRSWISGHGKGVSGKSSGCAERANLTRDSACCSGAQLLQRISRRDAEPVSEAGGCAEIGIAYADVRRISGKTCADVCRAETGEESPRARPLPPQGNHAVEA